MSEILNKVRDSALEPEPDVQEDLHRAANALLNTLWQTVYSGSRTFEENWLEMDRRFPQSRWLHDALKQSASLSSELDRLREENRALVDIVQRAQAIVSTSTYPNWHASARAALSPDNSTQKKER